ncbi:MAG: hypothetical protein KA368_11390 [Acidobacteria bacterium]|nr:hypothetical protein [Acidobacteriota bacterium]
MQILLLASAGLSLTQLIGTVNYFVQSAINLIIGVVVILLIIRWLMDVFDVSPFGRITYYLRQPTDKLVGYARSSRFYYPMRQALKINPTILIALIGIAIVWFALMIMTGYLTMVVSDLALSLDAFGSGDVVSGVRFLIGTLLISAIFFLMSMMLLIFINWITGLFDHLAFRALRRLDPLLRVFEFGGKFAGWSFTLLWFALYLASRAVQAVFF